MKRTSTLQAAWHNGWLSTARRGCLSFIPHPSSLIPPKSLILSALCAALFLPGIHSRGLWASHEARAAQNAQGMLDDGNCLLPRLYDGQVELQKPPGFYWLVATVGSARGEVDAVAIRLPSVLAATITVLLVWSHLRKRGRPVAGFIAGAVLASAVHFTGTARIGRIDIPLACAVTALILVSRDALADRERSRSAGASRLTKSLGIGAIAGFALLLKGPIGVVLPAGVLMVYCIGERRAIRSLFLPAVVALLIAAPWYLWANTQTDGDFFRVFFVYHHFGRAFGGTEALAGHPWWHYLPRFAADFLPWTPLLMISLVARRWRGDPDARFGLVWLCAMVVLLSVSRFKRGDYLLPAYPGAAIFLGCALERWYLSRTPATRTRAACGFAITLALVPAGWFLFDHLVTAREEAARSHAPFARQVRDVAPAPESIVLFQVESHELAYHLGRPVHTLVQWADLADRLRPPGDHFVVTRAEALDDVRAAFACPIEVVARSADGALVPPHRPLILLRIRGDTCPKHPPTD